MNNDYLYKTEEEKSSCNISWKNILNVAIIIIVIILLLSLAKNYMEPKKVVSVGGGLLTPSEIRLTAISAFEK